MLKTLSHELVKAISSKMIMRVTSKIHHVLDSKGNMLGHVIFDKEHEMNLVDECHEWKRIIDTYFKTSYRAYSLRRAGIFINIRPIKIYDNNVYFTIESADLVESWQEWFMIEGELYAP